jgi:hypothetical protein
LQCFLADWRRKGSEGYRSRTFVVEVEGGDIVISLPDDNFRAVYYKPAGQPQLIIRMRTKTDDYELLADVWRAAKDKARELGWIV